MAVIKDDPGLMTVLAPPTRASSDPVMAGEPFRIGEQVGAEARADCARSKAS
jgi:hypothetical protein